MFNVLQGFDEYMNLVLDDAEELNVKTSTRKSLGFQASQGRTVILSTYRTHLVEG